MKKLMVLKRIMVLLAILSIIVGAVLGSVYVNLVLFLVGVGVFVVFSILAIIVDRRIERIIEKDVWTIIPSEDAKRILDLVDKLKD
jgi:hypothetical protein